MIINCTKGLIDATGCRIYITEAEGYTSLSGDISVPGDGYNLKIASLDKEKNIDFVISQFSEKRKAEWVHNYIANTVKEGEGYIDIREYEET
ncbi:MAG: hypothetical protein OXU23_19930 [Candidatus Poribacteria bacterium]|nr:hypothetical protein [Candidatus Poribacteria bacterium]